MEPLEGDDGCTADRAKSLEFSVLKDFQLVVRKQFLDFTLKCRLRMSNSECYKAKKSAKLSHVIAKRPFAAA